MGWKEIFAHKRTWALIIGLVFQGLAAVFGVFGSDNAAYIVENAPYLLAALWTALVLGQAYEDRITRGASSALTVHLGPTAEGGWKFALKSLLTNKKFVVTAFGTVLAIVALCVPWWAGLPKLEEAFTKLSELIVILTGALTVGMAYSSAHDELNATPLPAEPAPETEEDASDIP